MPAGETFDNQIEYEVSTLKMLFGRLFFLYYYFITELCPIENRKLSARIEYSAKFLTLCVKSIKKIDSLARKSDLR